MALKDEGDIISAIIYPNPVKNRLNVKIALRGDDKVTILLTDIAGRHLQEKIIEAADGETIIIFNVSHLSAGIYLSKVLSAKEKENSIQKFIKD